jgi:hypothetical protein
VIEALGLTRPGEWFSRWSSEEPRIPISPEERYRQAVEQVEGWGTLGLRKRWLIGERGVDVEYVTTTIIHKGDIAQISDGNLVLAVAGMARFEREWTLSRIDGSAPVGQVVVQDDQEQTLPGSWKRWSMAVSPQIGRFQPGELLRSQATIRARSAYEDAFLISRPTKFLFFELRFQGSPIHLGNPKVLVFRTDGIPAAPDELTAIDEFELDIVQSKDGYLSNYSALYPDVGTFHYIRWDVTYPNGDGQGELPNEALNVSGTD